MPCFAARRGAFLVHFLYVHILYYVPFFTVCIGISQGWAGQGRPKKRVGYDMRFYPRPSRCYATCMLSTHVFHLHTSNRASGEPNQKHLSYCCYVFFFSRRVRVRFRRDRAIFYVRTCSLGGPHMLCVWRRYLPGFERGGGGGVVGLSSRPCGFGWVAILSDREKVGWYAKSSYSEFSSKCS